RHIELRDRRSQSGLVRRRLPRHRSGTDRHHDREPPQWTGVGHDEEESACGERTETCRVYGRVAPREMKFEVRSSNEELRKASAGVLFHSKFALRTSKFVVLLAVTLACTSHPTQQDRLKFWGLGRERE